MKRFKRRIIQPVFGVKMSNKDSRKSILVNEAQFTEFDNRRKALGMNSTELLDALLQQEVERTTTLKIERGTDFDNCEKRMVKRCE